MSTQQSFPMNADMVYLQKALEADTEELIQIRKLMDFIRESKPNGQFTQDQIDRIETFETNWTAIDSFPEIYVCFIKGSPFKSFGDNFMDLKVWIGAAKKLNPEYIHFPSTEVVKFQPYNLDDFFRMQFWWDLHRVVGKQLIQSMFENCIFIYKIKENLFLLVNSSDTILQKKINEAFKSKGNFKKFSRNGGNGKICKFINPYEIPQDAINVKKRKFGEDEVDLRPYPTKISKIAEDPIPISKSLEVQSIPENSPVQATSLNPNHLKIVKWITPTETLLNQIIDLREGLKKSVYNLSESYRSKLAIEGNIQSKTFPSYICVYKDETYLKSRAQLNVITKIISTYSKNEGENTRPEINGLKVDIEKLFQNTAKSKIKIYIYGISENFAKQLKIRIRPRVKKRKVKKVANPEKKNASNPLSNEMVSSDHPIQKTITSSDELLMAHATDDEYLNHTPPQPTFPYNQTYSFPTGLLIYNLNPRALWPRENTLARAIKRGTCIKSRVDALLTLIIKRTGEDPNRMGNNGQNSKLTDAKVKYHKLDMIKLENTLSKVVQFHTRVSDTQRLIRSCLSHWIIKEKQAQLVKDEKREIRKQRIAANKLNKSSKISNETTTNPECNPTPHLPGVSFQTPANRSNTVLTDNSWLKRKVPLNFSELKKQIPHSALLSTLSHIMYLSGAHLLLGSNKNRKAFMTFVKKSLCVGIRSSLQLAELMSKLDPDSCDWMPLIRNKNMKIHLLAKVAVWLIEDYIFTFVRIGFYATEVGHTRQQIAFYLRETWKSVTDQLTHQFMKNKILSHMSEDECNRVKPIGRVRYIPKKNNGVRPIIALSKDIKSDLAPYAADFKLILNYIKMEMCPYACSNNQFELLQRWKIFQKEWEDLNKPYLYYIRLDIQDAFPSVKIEKLKEILFSLEIASPSDGVAIYSRKDFKKVGHRFKSNKFTLVNERNHNNWSASIFNRPAIYAYKKNSSTKINTRDCLKKLCTILSNKSCTFNDDNGKYNFEYGLPQGWALSQLLCDIYYGFVELKYLSKFTSGRGEFFVRSVDDYFFITPYFARISEFADKMRKGFPEYNVKINSHKWESNLDVRSDKNIKDIHSNSDEISFCGWKFGLGSESGHVSRDFSAYEGLEISSSISFLLKDSNPEVFICDRMRIITPLRINQILLDPEINCRSQILLNVYQGFLMQAYRFYAMCRVVYPDLTILKDENKSIRLAKGILSSSEIAVKHVMNMRRLFNEEGSKVMNKCKCRISNACTCKDLPEAECILCTGIISQNEIRYLFYYAFFIKLNKHSNVFKNNLLKHIKVWISKLKASMLLSDQNIEYLKKIAKTVVLTRSFILNVK